MNKALTEAADLLEADLVWSRDLETIRKDLAILLRLEAAMSRPRTAAVKLSQALIDDFSNEMTVG